MINVQCSTTHENLQAGDCPYIMPKPDGMFLAPVGNKNLTATQLADIAQSIKNNLKHADKNKRWYNVPCFLAEDISTAEQLQEDEEGIQYVSDDVKYAFRLRLNKGGKCLHKQLRSFNNLFEHFVLFPYSIVAGMTHLHSAIDEELDADGNTQYCGWDLSMMFAPGIKVATRTTKALMDWLVGFSDTMQVNDTYGVHKFAANAKKFKGVQEVQLVDVTPSGAASGVYHVKPLAGCGTVNLAEVYGSTLADVDAWITKNNAAAELDITSIALGATGDHYVITQDTGDSDYNATDAANINLEPIADLIALGIAAIESSKGLDVVQS